MTTHGVRNFATLTSLVVAARVHLSDTDPTDVVGMTLDAAVVGWLCLGT